MKRLPLLLLFLLACRPAERPRPDVILISIDTLRADRVGAGTPNIGRLAADAITFERAWSHVPLTLPSHASILTGMLPPEHGVRDNAGFRLDPKTPTIATRLKAGGWATGGFVSAYVLRKDTGIANGFDVYDDRIEFVEGAPQGNLQRAGRETIAAAKAWLDARDPQKPFFLFVHLFEPHTPYEPTYDADVAAADRAVGELLDDLRTRGKYDGAMIVLLSDHGEGLGDHGETEHGVLLYREALQVPLIVKLPRNERRGTRVAADAQLIDVLPMIVAQSVPREQPPRAAYAETLYPRIHLGWSELRSIVRWPFHLIDGPRPELYHLGEDPHERTPRDERRKLAELRADLPAATAAPAPNVSAEEARKLAALGYVSGGAAVNSNLNPRDHLQDLGELKAVTERMQRRDFADAAKRMEALLARNPGWSDLRDQLGVAYEELGDFPAAERTYREAIRVTPELARDFALSLAGVLLAQNKLDEAAAHAKVALETNPAGAHRLLGEIALARNDLDAAQREAAQAPADLPTLFLRARIHAKRGDAPNALLELKKMYDLHKPLPAGYWQLTGDMFARLGRTADANEAYARASSQSSARPAPGPADRRPPARAQ